MDSARSAEALPAHLTSHTGMGEDLGAKELDGPRCSIKMLIGLVG